MALCVISSITCCNMTVEDCAKKKNEKNVLSMKNHLLCGLFVSFDDFELALLILLLSIKIAVIFSFDFFFI